MTHSPHDPAATGHPEAGGYPPLENPPHGGTSMPPPGAGWDPGGGTPRKRSAIPLVIGILMIVFAALGILFSLIDLATGGFGDVEDEVPGLEPLGAWETVGGVIGLGLALFQLTAGVAAVRYRQSAPKLVTIFATVAIIWTITNLIVVYTWLMPALEGTPYATGIGIGLVVGGIFTLAWPIIALALMNKRSAKDACVN